MKDRSAFNFVIPQHVSIEEDGSATPGFAGWSRRDWVLREAATLEAEAAPPPDSRKPRR